MWIRVWRLLSPIALVSALQSPLAIEEHHSARALLQPQLLQPPVEGVSANLPVRIALASDATPSEQLAAKELQSFLSKLCPFRAFDIGAPEPGGTQQLAVGRGAALALGAPADALQQAGETTLLDTTLLAASGSTIVSGGPDRGALEMLAQTRGIAECVIFAGFAGQDEVLAHLRRSDVLLLPSFAEGVPVSLMEAMACGLPVIATYVGGVVELVEPARTGQVVYAGDPVSLSESIARYLDDGELRARVSRQGRDKVVAEFNMDTEIDKLAALFAQHAGGSRQ
jgi:hypothetical protein